MIIYSEGFPCHANAGTVP